MKGHEEEINMHLVGTNFVLQFEAHIFTLVHLTPHGAQTLCVKDTYVPPVSKELAKSTFGDNVWC